ncbi:exodeoxyribonuclease VII large subunit [Stappia sp. P2PMeth1]|uniref:exodeoxyribonuclease VII large subunit n=1 Tax=Stappia sp. P2PMeth1 TaxID=2003586 RepID=UPI001FCC18B7|nr:exodeoxyribonuclease VII large subunit [Stappia sp. P2PMeth1]
MADSDNLAEYSVSEISGAIKRTMEDAFGYVRVRGELGRISRPGSGHIYLDLKDAQSVLSGVIWRGQASRLKIQPEQGLEVIATGKITTFPGQSKYQMVIDSLEPAGVGALMALLEERRRKLLAEGLFAEERKRRLPFLPRVIGVVTSPTGAVIRDILHRISDRFPLHVLVWPVRVQGETSAREVANGIEGFNRLEPGGAIPRPDVIIVARGGGSIEDLWGFNEEIVVRAAAASDIPLISAVGHETDWTLIDHAADLRAPTPTGAAEIAVPVRGELMASVDGLARRQISGLLRLIAGRRTELRAASAALPSPRDLLALPRQRLDTYAERLAPALRAALRDKRARHLMAAGRLSPHTLARTVLIARERLGGLEARALRAHRQQISRDRARLDAVAKLLESLSYKNVLARGYALVRGADGQPLRSAHGVQPGDGLTIEFGDDSRLAATAAGGDPAGGGESEAARPAPRATPRPKTRAPGKGRESGQGSLF